MKTIVFILLFGLAFTFQVLALASQQRGLDESSNAQMTLGSHPVQFLEHHNLSNAQDIDLLVNWMDASLGISRNPELSSIFFTPQDLLNDKERDLIQTTRQRDQAAKLRWIRFIDSYQSYYSIQTTNLERTVLSSKMNSSLNTDQLLQDLTFTLITTEQIIAKFNEITPYISSLVISFLKYGAYEETIRYQTELKEMFIELRSYLARSNLHIDRYINPGGYVNMPCEDSLLGTRGIH